MGPFAKILILIFFISFITFITFFGRLPALRHTPIAGLYRAIWVHTPNALLALDRRVTAGRFSGSLMRLGNHLAYDRHPTVVIFFVLVLAVSEVMFLPAAWPVMAPMTRFTGTIAVIAPYVFLYLACAVDPGYVTPSSHTHHMSMYAYDYILFHPGRYCKTCDMLKPPRSKHCSTCKRCVARSDHHCIFINGCVGYGNHHWFLLLLFSTAVLTAYGGVLGMSILAERVERNQPTWKLWKPHTNLSWTRWLGLFSIGIRGDVGLGASTLLSGLISPLVWCLFLYSMWLVYCGTTTNESLKWSEWKEDCHDGYAFARHLPVDRQIKSEPAWTRWPAQPERIMVATNDGEPPQDEQSIPGKGEWERVTSLSDVVNLYDLGFWNNLKDVFILDHAFGSEKGEPICERKMYDRRKRNGAVYPP